MQFTTIADPLNLRLFSRDADDREHVLYDPEAGKARGNAINNCHAFPNGRLIALHAAGAAAEIGEIGIINVATGCASRPDRPGVGADVSRRDRRSDAREVVLAPLGAFDACQARTGRTG